MEKVAGGASRPVKEWRGLKRKAGLTLVEALVSVLILGLALGIMLHSFIMGNFSVVNAKHRIEAMGHARAAMEQYIDDGTTTYTITSGDISSLSGACSIAETLNYGGYTGITRVVVTISWNERSWGSTKGISEQLVTLIRE